MTGTSEASPCPNHDSTHTTTPSAYSHEPPTEVVDAHRSGRTGVVGDEQMETAQHVFATLAPLLAARRSMRLWNPTTVPPRFADRAQTLTRKLPDQPAAVPIYLHGRTRLLVLDFDAKHGHSPATVDHDVEHCLTLLHACGAPTVSDRSTSGGRHILVPLAEGTTLPRTEIEPVLRALADRLPSLDISPMLNDRTGSITPPGSRCREGGFRLLDGPLDHAAHALTVRSSVTFWPSFARLLSTNTGSGPSAARDDDRVRAGSRTSRAGSRATAPTSDGTPPDDLSRVWEGAGDHARLRAGYRRHTPMPAVVLAFAREGRAPQQRWRAPDGRLDRSAARQSVLTAAALRGYSFTDLLAELPARGGTWTGLAAAYHRYGTQSHRALRRDWNSACHWTSRHAPEFLSHAHKNIKHTGGSTRATKHTGPQRRWLTAAIAWTDAQWPNSPKRWTAHAVLQALAHASTLNGALHRGTPTVEFGGRSLSLMAGGMPETTLWQILREIRDLPGAPILRIRAATGHFADRYALTTPLSPVRPSRPAAHGSHAPVSNPSTPPGGSSACNADASTRPSSTEQPTLRTRSPPPHSAAAPDTPRWPHSPPQDSSTTPTTPCARDPRRWTTSRVPTGSQLAAKTSSCGIAVSAHSGLPGLSRAPANQPANHDSTPASHRARYRSVCIRTTADTALRYPAVSSSKYAHVGLPTGSRTPHRPSRADHRLLQKQISALRAARQHQQPGSATRASQTPRSISKRHPRHGWADTGWSYPTLRRSINAPRAH